MDALDEEHHNFLERDRAKIEPIKPFWPPTRWKQVIQGDNCLYSNQPGQILDVDRSKRIAKINLNGETIKVTSLSKIFVPTQRLEGT